MRASRTRRGLMAVFSGAIVVSVGIAGEPAPKSAGNRKMPLESARSVLASLKAHRDRLQSGVFRAYGLYSDVHKPDSFSAPVDMYGAFDRSNQRNRFDRSQPEQEWLRSEEIMKAEKGAQLWKLSYNNTRAVLTPQEILVMEERGSEALPPTRQILVYSPSQPELSRFGGFPFDVRALGLLSFDELNHPNTNTTLDYLLEHAVGRTPPVQVERDGVGLWKIVWSSEHGGLRTLWIDEPKGFTIVRSETRLAHEGGTPLAGNGGTETSQIAWIAYGDVWLPKSFQVQQTLKNRASSYDVSLEWDLVNQAVSESLFRRDGLAVNEKTYVADVSTGRGFLAEVLNDERPPQPYYQVNETNRNSPLIVRALLINGLLASCVLCAMIYRWQRCRQTPG